MKKRIKKYTGCVRSVKKGYWHTGKINKTDIYKAVKEEKQKRTPKESYEIYGSPKITELLNKKGDKVSQKYVYSIMKENNIKAKYIKPYIQTTVSHDFSDKLKNLLNRHYNPTKPNVTW
ncbi:IS3 family transposase [Faecalibacillus intestinalis]|uniref:IS3 family transposase n=1 Tax=Faecalibacillus intestinalis TaxID=1982626 RepID=UPI000E47FDC6|nr:IS3 family transposase [Faecalibacillus intestinalis]RHP50668.1 transposase [Coprobacillus sp. AF31-1BH]RHP76919.1 transposase [Coprobacillus sp. OF03-2AA]